MPPASSYVASRAPALGILRTKDDGDLSQSFGALPADVRARAKEPLPVLTITKANTRSTVHRSTYLDFIGVKRFAADGTVIGEHRFMGLLTSAAYSMSPHQIPLLDRKVARIVERAGFTGTGHAGKALLHILETYPRDELLQTNEDELFQIALGILQLQDRQRLRLFVRADTFGRYVACLVFVPRDRYNTALRERMQQVLEHAFGATESEFQAQLSESSLARLLFTLRTPNAVPAEVDTADLERRLLEISRSWPDRLRDALIEAAGEEHGNRLFEAYGRAFPASYQERVDARAAVPDILSIDRLAQADAGDLTMSLYRPARESGRADPLQADPPRSAGAAVGCPADPGEHGPSGAERGAEPDRGPRRAALLAPRFRSAADGRRAVDVDAVARALPGPVLGRLGRPAGERRLQPPGAGGRARARARSSMLRAYCQYLLQIGTPSARPISSRRWRATRRSPRDLVDLFDARFDPDARPTSAAAAGRRWRRGSASS